MPCVTCSLFWHASQMLSMGHCIAQVNAHRRIESFAAKLRYPPTCPGLGPSVLLADTPTVRPVPSSPPDYKPRCRPAAIYFEGYTPGGWYEGLLWANLVGTPCICRRPRGLHRASTVWQPDKRFTWADLRPPPRHRLTVRCHQYVPSKLPCGAGGSLTPTTHTPASMLACPSLAIGYTSGYTYILEIPPRVLPAMVLIGRQV